MKVDGRKLKKDIKRFLARRYPERNPRFTVQTKWTGSTRVMERPRIEVYFTDLDTPSGSWEVYNSVSDWVRNIWLPANHLSTEISRTEYTYVFGRKIPSKRTCILEGVDVVLGGFAL